MTTYRGLDTDEVEAVCDYLDVPEEQRTFFAAAILEALKVIFVDDFEFAFTNDDRRQEAYTWAMENEDKVRRSVERGNFGLFIHDLKAHLRGAKIREAEDNLGHGTDDEDENLAPIVRHLLPEAVGGGDRGGIRGRLLDDVLYAYDMLDEDDRWLVDTYFVTGIRQADIARTLDLTQQAVSARIESVVRKVASNVSKHSPLDQFRTTPVFNYEQAKAGEVSPRLNENEKIGSLERTVKKYAAWRYANFISKRIAANIDNERRFAELKRKTMGAITWE